MNKTSTKVQRSRVAYDGVELLQDGKGFPFLVIEYLDDKKVVPSDSQIHLGTSFGQNDKVKESYDAEDDSFIGSKIVIPMDDSRVYKERWAYVRHIVVVEPSPLQIYFSESLNHPHYSVHPMEYESYKKHVRSFQNKNKGLPLLTFCENTKNHASVAGMLTVTNIMDDPLLKLIQNFALKDIIQLVDEHGTHDARRGNNQLDTGLASSQCQKRLDKWYGLSGPNELKHTGDPIIKETFRALYPFLRVAVPKDWSDKLYRDPLRRGYFSFDDKVHVDKEVLIQSCRIASSKKYMMLEPHRDDKNDNENANFSPVPVLAWLVKLKGVATRIALITYSRKSVFETLKRIQRYGPAIRSLSSFFKILEEKKRVLVNPDLFEQEYERVGLSRLLAARIPCHVDPAVHYSAIGADAILKLNRKYKLTFHQGIALLFSVCASNTPDYFRTITNEYLENEELGKDYFQNDALHIVSHQYEMIFQYKSEASRNKHGHPGQRHQTCANKQATREVVKRSLTNLIKICSDLAVWNGTSWRCKKEVRDLYLSVHKKIGESVEKGGVYGAGTLISNKIIQIGSLVGLFPRQFLFESVIASSTNTFKYLKRNFSLDKTGDSPFLLDALSFMTGLNLRLAEGLCCKAAQHRWLKASIPLRTTPYVDTIFPEMSIIIPKTDTKGKLGKISLYEITSFGEALIPEDDFVWKNGDSSHEMPWVQCGGYWMGTLDEPVSRTSAKKVSKSKVKPRSPKIVPNLIAKPNRGQGPGPKKKQKVDPQVEEIIECEPFNWPSQADILLSPMESRVPYQRWRLLGKALGIPGGTAGYKHISMSKTNDGRSRWIPSIVCGNGSVYYPPVPTKAWINAQFEVTANGQVSFPTSKIASKYAIIHFLQDKYRNGFNEYLTYLLRKENKFRYTPKRCQGQHNRERDPARMVVFYDNDQRCGVPVAICVSVKHKQKNGSMKEVEGAFALVDDFGKVIEDTVYRFAITGNPLRKLKSIDN